MTCNVFSTSLLPILQEFNWQSIACSSHIYSFLGSPRGFLEKEGLQLLRSNCQLTFQCPCCPSNKKFKQNLILRDLNNKYGNLCPKQIANIKPRNWQPQNFVKELKASRMGLNILSNKSLKILYL